MASLNVPTEFLEDYMNHIKADYDIWWGPRASTDIARDMIEKFRNAVRYEVGHKYVKIITDNSVHSFIVNKAGKFPLGTVLKAASWKTPAVNFARANLLDRKTWTNRVRWTGVI